MDAQERQHQETGRGPKTARKSLPLLFLGMALACLGLTGCGTWDELTSRDFHFKNMFASPPSPLVVLRDSTDGDHRQKALRQLREPKLNGGTDADQDLVVNILLTAATSERQALCRLAAIQTLSKFKDPRAVAGLTEAYYRATSFPAETSTLLRCAALSGLGQTGNPTAVETLVKALREPPVVGDEVQMQNKMDERIAAARALGHYRHYQATEALLGVLQKEKDVALRDRATESLQEATGKDYPADAQVWADFLHNKPQSGQPKDEDGLGKKVLDWVVPTGWRK